MKRISRSVVFYTRVYPALLCLVLLVFTIEWVIDVAFNASDRSVVEMVVAWAFGTFMSVVAWRRAYSLADEVLDAGDYLIVRMGAKSARVPITDIECVSKSVFSNLHRIELRLVWPGPLGSVIAFLPAHSFLVPFVPSVVSRDLTTRVERAQRTES